MRLIIFILLCFIWLFVSFFIIGNMRLNKLQREIVFKSYTELIDDWDVGDISRLQKELFHNTIFKVRLKATVKNKQLFEKAYSIYKEELENEKRLKKENDKSFQERLRYD